MVFHLVNLRRLGNKIEVVYLSCVGAAANNASLFSPTDTVSVAGSNYALNVTTIANSGVGGARQSIESVRQNAPIAFAAQQRLVTAEDYRAVIQRNYATVTDAIAWGGEDNVPANFGKVYVSLVFEDGTTGRSTKRCQKLNYTRSDNQLVYLIN